MALTTWQWKNASSTFLFIVKLFMENYANDIQMSLLMSHSWFFELYLQSSMILLKLDFCRTSVVKLVKNSWKGLWPKKCTVPKPLIWTVNDCNIVLVKWNSRYFSSYIDTLINYTYILLKSITLYCCDMAFVLNGFFLWNKVKSQPMDGVWQDMALFESNRLIYNAINCCNVVFYCLR